jgi:hypothetical protein
VLIAALERNKLCKAMYKAFGVNYTETQGPLQPLTTTEVTEYTEKPLKIKSVIIRRHNHNYSPSNLNRSVFSKKPTIGR